MSRVSEKMIRWLRPKNKHNNMRCDHVYDISNEITAPLIGGGHTVFILLTCTKCDNKEGFPSDNVKIALENGTEDTKEKLKKLGITNIK